MRTEVHGRHPIHHGMLPDETNFAVPRANELHRLVEPTVASGFRPAVPVIDATLAQRQRLIVVQTQEEGPALQPFQSPSHRLSSRIEQSTSDIGPRISIAGGEQANAVAGEPASNELIWVHC